MGILTMPALELATASAAADGVFAGTTQLNRPYESSGMENIMSTTKRVLGGALASLVGVAAALFLGAAPAYADNGPHVRVAGTPGGGQLVSELQPRRCTACHRIHTAKSADGRLLKTEQVSLCYSCHGDGGTGAITNVQSGIAYSGAVAQDPVTGQWATAVRGGEVGALRGGGFDRAMIDAGAAKQASGRNDPVVVPGLIPAATVVEGTSGNHMGGQGIVWGSGPISQAAYSGQALPAGVQLECGSCHDPHATATTGSSRPSPTSCRARRPRRPPGRSPSPTPR